MDSEGSARPTLGVAHEANPTELTKARSSHLQLVSQGHGGLLLGLKLRRALIEDLTMQAGMDTKLELQMESSIFDLEEALARLDGDEQLLEELAQIFLKECPEILQKLQDAVARGDAQAVAMEAHSMKGSVSNFGVKGATEAALEIERMGRQRDLRSVPEALHRLETVLDRLWPALTYLAEKREVPDGL
jgi:HPt (histidine-containing phosphotransfer) domain-containing protein